MKLANLQPELYERVRPLLGPLADYPFCAAVLEGLEPGRVLVDDPDAPGAVFLLARDVWGYLGGDPGHADFNAALNEAIFSRAAVPDYAPLLQLTCHPEAWYDALPAICAPREPVREARKHYVARALHVDWRARVPEGFAVAFIDAAQLDRPDTAWPEDVQRILDLRSGADDPDRRGFGFVALREGEVAAYAVVDCVAGEAGEIFLFTADAYRKQGLATLLTAATIEHGLAHGLAAIVWDCATGNLGSLRTAERLDLTLLHEYAMHYFLFDEAEHLANLAWMALQAGDPREAIARIDEAAALGEALSPMAHFLAARAWAGMGAPERSLEHLTSAVAGGFGTWGYVESSPEFAPFLGLPDWAALVARLTGAPGGGERGAGA